MFTDQEVETVKQHFTVFNPPPAVLQEDEYVSVEKHGLSVSKDTFPTLGIGGKTVQASRFTTYDHEGNETGDFYSLGEAIKNLMEQYARELFYRTDDRLTTQAQAEEYQRTTQP